jgi:HEAT repeat protein
MIVPKPVPFNKLIEALLDESIPFSPRYLHRLSDLEPPDIATFSEAWPKVSTRRRQALLEDLEELHIADDLLCFEDVGRTALKDSEPEVRKRAISILREYELVDLLPTFIHMAEHDPDAEVRAASAGALATYIYMGEVEDISPQKLQRVEECLLRLTSGNDSQLVRRKALEALGFSSRKEVNELIEKAFSSPEINWLVSALYAMGHSANSYWKPHIIQMLAHQRPVVRAEAASAAGELEIKSSIPKLLELLEDVDSDVRMASIWSLSQIGGPGVRSALEALLEITEDDEEAHQIDNALENLDFTEEMNELALIEIPEDENALDETSENDDDDHDEFGYEDDEI